MEMNVNMLEWLVVLYACWAMVLDLTENRISNRYLIFGWAVGGIMAFLSPLPFGILQYLGGALLPMICLFLLFYYRMLGAGDIKLLSVLGGMVGIRASALLMICSFLAGAVLAVVRLTVTCSWSGRFRFFVRYISNYRTTGIRVPYRPAAPGRENLHFAVPVLAAVILWKGGVL